MVLTNNKNYNLIINNIVNNVIIMYINNIYIYYVKQKCRSLKNVLTEYK